MILSLRKFLEGIIWFSFLALATVTPLIFSTQNSELFEVPKMHFVYFVATIIFFATIAKFVLDGKISIPKNWTLVAFSAFIFIQALSAFTSIDKFTSVFGYPSRLNGGLLSQFAYFVIFAGALINLNIFQAKKIVLAIIVAALAVALWGIPGHFGSDPSCLILTGKLTSTCWQADFNPQVRIFSTLGQPNWLASYMVIVLPLSIGLMLSAKKLVLRNFFLVSPLVFYTALLMTNSRAGILGFAVGLVIFFVLTGLKAIKQDTKDLSLLFAGIILLTFLFGDFLYARFKEGINKSQVTGDQSQEETTEPSNYRTTQPAPPTSGPTESSEIRLIVWQGAVEAFKHKPILGFGPETFAYSYYQFRPAEHNQTTEWNFFYNKAHNEFLNYLTNIGVLGLISYLLLITSIIFALFKKAPAALAAFLGYLVTIFFGFSIVPTQVAMYLIVGLSLIPKDNKFLEIKLPMPKLVLPRLLLLLIVFLYALTIPARFFFADLQIAKGKTPKRIENTIFIFPFKNPFYLAELAYADASAASDEEDFDLASQIAQKADLAAQKSENLSPNNLIIRRKIANSYLLIADLDEKYQEKAIEAGQELVDLAPTDPQSYLTLAKVQSTVGQIDKAKQSVEKSLTLKPDYVDALELLDQINTQLTTNN